MSEEQLIRARAEEQLSQWPDTRNAMGCLDCEMIYRVGHGCPRCGSYSTFNVAKALWPNGVVPK